MASTRVAAAMFLAVAAQQHTSWVQRPNLLAQRIAHRDLAARHDLAIDAAVGVTEDPQQRLRQREIADAGVGIDVGRRAAHDALDDSEPRAWPDRDFPPHEIELAPGGPAG